MANSLLYFIHHLCWRVVSVCVILHLFLEMDCNCFCVMCFLSLSIYLIFPNEHRLETQVDVGNVVHLLSDNGGPHPCTDFDIVVSDDSGHIVVNPDLLLSGTTILSGVNCPRRYR